jgi:hypothetical protein
VSRLSTTQLTSLRGRATLSGAVAFIASQDDHSPTMALAQQTAHEVKAAGGSQFRLAELH